MIRAVFGGAVCTVAFCALAPFGPPSLALATSILMGFVMLFRHLAHEFAEARSETDR